jgi:hypothetical protein
MEDNNEKRLIANQIMHDLYSAGDKSQLEILRDYVNAAIEELEK